MVESLQHFNNPVNQKKEEELERIIKELHEGYFTNKKRGDIEINQSQYSNLNTGIQEESKEKVLVIVNDKFRKVNSENNIQQLDQCATQFKKSLEYEDLYSEYDDNCLFEDIKACWLSSCNGGKLIDKKESIVNKYRKLSKDSTAQNSGANEAEQNDRNDKAKSDLDKIKPINNVPTLFILSQLNDSNYLQLNENKLTDLNNLQISPITNFNLKLTDESVQGIQLSTPPKPLDQDENSLNEKKEMYLNKKSIMRNYPNISKEKGINMKQKDKYPRDEVDLKKLIKEEMAYNSLTNKLEDLVKNINSNIPDSEKIIKAYKSKLKTRNWNAYIENSKITEVRNKLKFYHKCNFPGCSRTFSSSGWLKTHLEDHMLEIQNDEFNKEFEHCVKCLGCLYKL